MVICLCHRISEKQLVSAVRQGCASFDELQFETGVATCCGVCKDCAREVFEAHALPCEASAAAEPIA